MYYIESSLIFFPTSSPFLNTKNPAVWKQSKQWIILLMDNSSSVHQSWNTWYLWDTVSVFYFATSTANASDAYHSIRKMCHLQDIYDITWLLRMSYPSTVLFSKSRIFGARTCKRTTWEIADLLFVFNFHLWDLAKLNGTLFTTRKEFIWVLSFH